MSIIYEVQYKFTWPYFTVAQPDRPRLTLRDHNLLRVIFVYLITSQLSVVFTKSSYAGTDKVSRLHK